MKIKNNMPIGVLSDTHGYLPIELQDIFKDVQLILHAGDFGGAAIYRQLQEIAPVLAVRGNNDMTPEYQAISPTEAALLEDNSLLYMVHDLYYLPIDPVAANCRVIIHGHTHISSFVEKDGVTYINPGSASRPRRGENPSVGILTIQKESLRWKRIELEFMKGLNR